MLNIVIYFLFKCFVSEVERHRLLHPRFCLLIVWLGQISFDDEIRFHQLAVVAAEVVAEPGGLTLEDRADVIFFRHIIDAADKLNIWKRLHSGVPLSKFLLSLKQLISQLEAGEDILVLHLNISALFQMC